MSDQEKLAEAMKELAGAINRLADKIPQAGLAGFTIYHQHSYPQPHYQPNQFYGGGGNFSSGPTQNGL